MVRQKVEPRLRQGQQVFCLLLCLEGISEVNQLINSLNVTDGNLSGARHTCRVRSCDMASKLRTRSSVAPELASLLILDNTALNLSPDDTQRIRFTRHPLEL